MCNIYWYLQYWSAPWNVIFAGCSGLVMRRTPTRRRKSGHPKPTRQRTAMKELEEEGLPWGEATGLGGEVLLVPKGLKRVGKWVTSPPFCLVTLTWKGSEVYSPSIMFEPTLLAGQINTSHYRTLNFYPWRVKLTTFSQKAINKGLPLVLSELHHLLHW